MISTRLHRFGAAIFMLITLGLSGEVLAKEHTTKKTHTAHVTAIKDGKNLASSKKEYSRNKGVSPDSNALYYQSKRGNYGRP